MRAVLVTAAVLWAAAVAAVVPASAAQLGGLRSTQLYAVANLRAPSAATITDTFSSTGTGTLTGRVSDTGQSWTVHSGGFNVTTGVVQPASQKVVATATVPVPNAETSTVRVTIAPSKTNWQAGLVIAGTADGATQFWAHVTNAAGGTLEVTRLRAGVETSLFSRTNVGAGAGTLSVTRSVSGLLTIAWGAGVSTFTLAASDRDLMMSSARAGLLVYYDKWVTFDNFTWSTT